MILRFATIIRRYFIEWFSFNGFFVSNVFNDIIITIIQRNAVKKLKQKHLFLCSWRIIGGGDSITRKKNECVFIAMVRFFFNTSFFCLTAAKTASKTKVEKPRVI